MNSVKLPRPKIADDFVLKVGQIRNGKVTANVIGMIENQAPNRHLQFEMRVDNGRIDADLERDIVKVALVERHQATGRVQLGLVHGFNLVPGCAIAPRAHEQPHLDCDRHYMP